MKLLTILLALAATSIVQSAVLHFNNEYDDDCSINTTPYNVDCVFNDTKYWIEKVVPSDGDEVYINGSVVLFVPYELHLSKLTIQNFDTSISSFTLIHIMETIVVDIFNGQSCSLTIESGSISIHNYVQAIAFKAKALIMTDFTTNNLFIYAGSAKIGTIVTQKRLQIGSDSNNTGTYTAKRIVSQGSALFSDALISADQIEFLNTDWQPATVNIQSDIITKSLIMGPSLYRVILSGSIVADEFQCQSSISVNGRLFSNKFIFASDRIDINMDGGELLSNATISFNRNTRVSGSGKLSANVNLGGGQLAPSLGSALIVQGKLGLSGTVITTVTYNDTKHVVQSALIVTGTVYVISVDVRLDIEYPVPLPFNILLFTASDVKGSLDGIQSRNPALALQSNLSEDGVSITISDATLTTPPSSVNTPAERPVTGEVTPVNESSPHQQTIDEEQEKEDRIVIVVLSCFLIAAVVVIIVLAVLLRKKSVQAEQFDFLN